MNKKFSKDWICRKNRGKLNAFFNNYFFPEKNEKKTWDAIETMCVVLSESIPKEKNFIRENFEKIRVKFRKVSQEDFIRILVSYYCAGKKEDEKKSYSILYKFEIGILLGFTHPDDYEGAKTIFEKIILALRSVPITEIDEKESDNFISAIKFYFTLIAEIHITNTWKNLISSAFLGDEKARNILKDVLIFPLYLGYGVKIVSASQWELPASFSYRDILDSVGYGSSPRMIRLPVSDEKEEFVSSLLREIENDEIKKNQELQGIISFFKKNFEKFTKKFLIKNIPVTTSANNAAICVLRKE